MKIPPCLLSLALALAATSLRAETPPVLEINLAAPTKQVSPTLHGLMTEEINFSYDGGLYGELIRNRAFLNSPADAVNWSLSNENGADGKMTVTEEAPLTDKLPKSLKVEIKAAAADKCVSLANEGYWGIPVKPNTTYRASFYVKSAREEKNKQGEITSHGFVGPLLVGLVSNEGGKILAQAQTLSVNEHWQKFEVALTTGSEVKPSASNKFFISAGNTGTFYLSLVSLFPPTYKNRANGNRVDLMEKMAAMKPTFLRFPGGNYLEGDKLWERFDWKATRGPLPFRPGHRSPWYYRSTDGMGLLEFMGWCEDLNMAPVLAVYAGYSMRQQAVEPGPLLEPYVQDALDEIEYLTGDEKTTYWGAQRAKDGHPAPFTLKYIEIGNEDNFDRSLSYDARFTQFFDAFKAKYPQLQLIATTSVKSRKPDLIDNHFYRNTKDFLKDIHHYDKTDRNGPKIFVGEWATREGGPTTNMNAALGDAAWMTGMERNSDLILMHCYAPLFVNVNPGGMQWSSNLIGYDALNSYGSPSFHAQCMFSGNIGNELPQTELKTAPDLPCSVTLDTKTRTVFIKVVNPGPTPQPVQINIQGSGAKRFEGQEITLSSANPEDTNTIAEPTKIVPVTEPVKVGASFTRTLKPYSVTVLKLGEKR